MAVYSAAWVPAGYRLQKAPQTSFSLPARQCRVGIVSWNMIISMILQMPYDRTVYNVRPIALMVFSLVDIESYAVGMVGY